MQRLRHVLPIQRIFITMAFSLSISACSSTPSTSDSTPSPLSWTPVSQSAQAKQMAQLLQAEFALQREGSEPAAALYLETARQSDNRDIAKRATSIAMMSDDSNAVMAASSRWIELDPGATGAYPITLQAMLNEGQTEQAQALLIQAIEHQVSLSFLPTFVDQNIRDTELIEHLDALLLSPELADNVFVDIAQFHVHFINGKYRYIVQHIEPLLARSPTTEQEGLIIIKAFSEEQLGSQRKAQNTLKQGLDRYPDSQRIMANYLEILVKNDHFQSAINAFNNAQFEPFLQQQIGISIAQLLLQKAQPEKSITLLETLPKQGNLRDEVFFLLANAQHQAQHYNDALQSVLQVFGKLSWEASSLLVQWLYRADQADAVNDLILKRAIADSEPGHITGVADMHLGLERADLAIDLLTRSLPLFPEADGLRYKRAITYDLQQQWPQALQDLTILYQKHPDDPAYINALGYTMMIRSPNEFERALGLIRKAYTLDSEDPAIMDSLGWAYFLQNDLEQAETLLSQAWDRLQDAEIGAHYGEVLWQLDEKENALEIWQQALKDNHELPVLLETLDQYAPELLGS